MQYPTFKRRQRVHALAFVGPTCERDWREKATITARETDFLDGNWYRVRFDNGDRLCVHASRLMAANQ